MIGRIVIFALGVLFCAVKGLLLPVLLLIPGEQNKEDMFDRCMGFCDPYMESEWSKVRLNRRFVHYATNIPVEYAKIPGNVTNPQRAVKVIGAVSILWGIAIGAILF